MKRRKKLRLKLFDEAQLVEKWEIRFSWINFSLISLLIMGGCIAVGIGIVWFTSLKTHLPGYMQESQRTASADMLLRLDSLIDVNEQNQRYLDNISAILEPGTAPADTARREFRHGHFMPDSLSNASEKEIQYVLNIQQKKENEQQRAGRGENGHIDLYNLHSESEGIGLVPKTNKLKIKLPQNSEVGSVGDGIVLSVHPYSKNTYSVMIQHPGGFISSVSGFDKIAVKEGEAVKAGGIVGIAAGEIITLQMWRGGISINPEDYINQKK